MPRHRSISDEEILTIALPLLARDGPERFTLATLGKATRLNPSTLLQRFGSKKNLIEQVFYQDNLRFSEWIENLPAGRGIEATLAVYETAINDFHAGAGLEDHLIWLREDIKNPAFNKLARERFALFRAAIIKRLPPVRLPKAEVVRLLDAQCHGAMMQWAIEPEGSMTSYVMRSISRVLRFTAK